MTAEQYSSLHDLPLNIVFFCSECVRKLPSALLAYDKTNETCESIEKKIDSVEITLSNKFAALADQLTDLSSKLSNGVQDLNDEMAAEDQSPCQEFPCQSPLSVKSIASMTASMHRLRRERERKA